MQFKYLLLGCLYYILCAPQVAGRESKEEKRQHTYRLRRFIQLVDFTMDDHGQPASLRKARVSELSEMFALVKAKLSQKRGDDFNNYFAAYQSSLMTAMAKDSRPHREAFLALRSQTLKMFKVVSTPALVPDNDLGHQTYVKFCMSCHGKAGRGDGRFTQNPSMPMVPSPKDFSQQIDAGVRSPFSYFNTLLMGSPGTAMRSYEKSLTKHEMWSLAFFIAKYPDIIGESYAPPYSMSVTLNDLATKTNADLVHALSPGGNNRKFLYYMRNVASFSKKLPRK